MESSSSSDNLCELCRKQPIYKTDSLGRWVCRRCAFGLPAPLKGRPKSPGRNQPCPCGSGKKYKHCCKPPSGRPLIVGPPLPPPFSPMPWLPPAGQEPIVVPEQPLGAPPVVGDGPPLPNDPVVTCGG